MIDGHPNAPRIAIVNASTVIKSGDPMNALINALQIQVHRDFAPIWGLDAELFACSSQSNPPDFAWELVILDDSDQAEALGYHELTRRGLPLGKVFAATDMANGTSWTNTASHEVLEMLADPWINECVEFPIPNRRDSQFYAREVCDACEADQYGYIIDGVLVSDFVTPAWFVPGGWPGRAFDVQGHITQPFQLLPGGYISIYDQKSGWSQITASLKEPFQEVYQDLFSPPRGSRRWRRLKWPKNYWRLSAPRVPPFTALPTLP